jgi:solute carrier family 30 (zinc transporter), member 2
MAAFVSVFFIVAQLVGGYLAGSIAILTDSAHLASDLIGFALSIISLNIAQKRADSKFSFGYDRAEIIGTVVSLSSIWIMTIFLLGEATKRFFIPNVVNSNLMLPISVMGLIFNLIQMKILHHDEPETIQDAFAGTESEHNKVKDPMVKDSLLHDGQAEKPKASGHDEPGRNINVDSAYLHVLGDMMMSLGVITAATVIYFRPDLWWFDPICTYAFALMILFTSYPTLKNCVDVMMEGAPDNIDASQLEQDIWDGNKADIIDVHDMHLWQRSIGKLSMSVHIKSRKPLKTLAAVTDLCRRKYHLFHTTIQVEGVDDPEQNPHTFQCENDIHD